MTREQLEAANAVNNRIAALRDLLRIADCSITSHFRDQLSLEALEEIKDIVEKDLQKQIESWEAHFASL